jgi:hypothetical protein
VPHGTYVVAGRSEGFSCAPGPAGWRYASDRLDLVCDNAFRCVRVQVVSPDGGWVRGGRTVLDDGTPVLVWRTAADPDRERSAVADVVDVASPGALVALARRVAGPGTGPAEGRLTAVRLEPPGFGGLTVRLRVARVGAQEHEAPGGRLLAERWVVDDVDAGTRREVHLAGDVVLWAAASGDPHAEPWDVELTALDDPPSPLR